MTVMLVVSFIIVFIVLLMAVITTNKAYAFKHTVDPIENNPHSTHEEEDSQQKQT